MNEGIVVNVDRESIQQIIEGKISAAVMAALEPDHNNLIRRLVEQVLTQKATGEKFRYTNSDKIPTVLQDLVWSMIETEMKAGLQRWVEKHRPDLQKTIDTILTKDKHWSKILVTQLIDGMTSATKWQFSVNVTPIVKGSN